jgi:hypothetical protein
MWLLISRKTQDRVAAIYAFYSETQTLLRF